MLAKLADEPFELRPGYERPVVKWMPLMASSLFTYICRYIYIRADRAETHKMREFRFSFCLRCFVRVSFLWLLSGRDI